MAKDKTQTLVGCQIEGALTSLNDAPRHARLPDRLHLHRKQRRKIAEQWDSSCLPHLQSSTPGRRTEINSALI